ncbi:MAG: Alkaline phosphatase [uncultured Thermomicrobiales bacterium]|uniref:Alkaline phosphatase n=1 Tax=uncultured Thermomicrobiales bacterium TaxID=1645740 RepID=A0A6J4VSH4_9BACT|nr:MAG: Alkaline phosphatase [uncultured Thermomicrobiales bacterium]
MTGGARDHDRSRPMDTARPPARNVILLVGDGMGQAHRMAGQLLTVGRAGRLAMDRLPHAGLMGTMPADPDHFVTDSAAAATALATGVKTDNGAIAIDPEGRSVPTILELAKRAGKATGLVTTCQITDATPAAFAAHVPHRSDQSEVARQYLEETGVDVILGGGAAYWYPAGAETPFPADPADPLQASRGTAGNLVARARALGYAVATSAAELHAAAVPRPRLTIHDDRTPTRLLGLFANQELFLQRTEGEGAAYDPPVSLAEMTGTAIALLARNPDGFFLMVEESAIDRMAHRNNAPLTLKGVLELDRAVQVALGHAAADPETLVVVTADHECGGLAIAGSDDPPYPYEPGGGLLETTMAGEDGPFPIVGEEDGFVMGWATTGHTAASVPLTAAGPGAERLAGVYENTFLFAVMAEALGLAVPAAGQWGANGSHAR